MLCKFLVCFLCLVFVYVGSQCCPLLPSDYPQEKKLFSLVLKLKVYDFRVFTGHITRCIAQLVLFLLDVQGTFFNASHQLKAIAIGIIEVNPLAENG